MIKISEFNFDNFEDAYNTYTLDTSVYYPEQYMTILQNPYNEKYYLKKNGYYNGDKEDGLCYKCNNLSEYTKRNFTLEIDSTFSYNILDVKSTFVPIIKFDNWSIHGNGIVYNEDTYNFNFDNNTIGIDQRFLKIVRTQKDYSNYLIIYFCGVFIQTLEIGEDDCILSDMLLATDAFDINPTYISDFPIIYSIDIWDNENDPIDIPFKSFSLPWLNVECQFLYDKVILTANVYNDDPLGYSLLWSTGERTRSIEVDYEEYPYYEVTATNRMGSETAVVDYFAYCGYDMYSLEFYLKEDLETPPIYNLEFDFKASVDELRPLIYLRGGLYDRTTEKVLSLGACYYSFNEYLYPDENDDNKVMYDNKYLNDWYHYKVHVDNTNLTVNININDNEVATINLNEELIPYDVGFLSGLNGFFGCTSDYYIDNLKITYKEEEWQH